MTENTTDIADFENRYDGERIFLVGNGPSLNDTPLEELDDEYTLAMNRIDHIYTDTDWRPSFYYCIVGENTLNDWIGGNREQDPVRKNVGCGIPSFIYSGLSHVYKDQDEIYYLDKFLLLSNNPFHRSSASELNNKPMDYLRKFWSKNPSHFVFDYHSMYGAIQLAAYMGFNEIYLIGCDLGMEYQNPHMICSTGLDPYRYNGGKFSYVRDAIRSGNLPESIINAIAMYGVRSVENNQMLERIFHQPNNDHFTADYFSSLSIRDNIKTEKEIQKSHVVAKRICENEGIDIYNATVGGKLEIYERENIKNIL